MNRLAALIALLVLAVAAPTEADRPRGLLTGDYLEARTCDVWVGACFANAEMNIAGKHATLAWKFDRGELGGITVDGLAVVAVVEANDTLGLEQKGPAKTALIIDQKADAGQAIALRELAKRLGGQLTQNVVSVRRAEIAFDRKCCKGSGCAKLVVAGLGRVETRCIHEDEDKVCGHEDSFYPPLTAGVDAKAAMILSHSFSGCEFGKTWDDASRRGAYVGSFRATE